MRTRLHANATTPPRVRAAIQASQEPVAVLARRYGVSQTTIRRWRGRSQVEDRSHARHRLGQATTPHEEAIIAELRTRAGLSLDDITEVMRRCLRPELSRGSVYSALRRAGLSGRAAAARAPAQRFADEPFGYVHADLMSLGKLGGAAQYLFVVIERTTRFVHVELLDDRRMATVAAAWARFVASFGHPVHTVLTDNGSEFTDRFRAGSKDGHAAKPTGTHPFDRICAAQGIRHRTTRPYTPKTNRMVERFNHRIGEAMRALPPARDNSRHGNRFTTQAERAEFIQAFVHTYNRTRLRCLQYQAPLQSLLNQTEHNTSRGLCPHPRPGTALRP